MSINNTVVNVYTTGLVGDQVSPRRCTMLTTQNLAAITAAGFLNGQNAGGSPILPTDIFDVIYSYNDATKQGTYGVFQVSYSSVTGFSLVLWGNPGDVLLPVVNGDFAIFNGITGQIKDAGYSPTNAAKTKVVMLNAAPTINHVAIFTAADGTVGDGGVLGTAAAKAASNNADAGVASVPASVVSGNLAKFSDTAGTLADQGIAFKSVAGAAAAGGSAAQSFTDAFCTSGSCVVGNWNTQANAESVLKIVPGNGSFVVTSTGDAGVGTFNYIITK
jgi:hypothetical protein